jgi:hypothetical protein
MVTAWNNPNHHFIELPSMEEIEEMDKQRAKATESLEISANKENVKCQRCSSLWPIIADSTTKLSTLAGKTSRSKKQTEQEEKTVLFVCISVFL